MVCGWLCATTEASVLDPPFAEPVSEFVLSRAASRGLTYAEVEAAVEQWVASVRRLDVAATVAQYDPECGRLLGTLDTTDEGARTTRAAIRAYFEMFLAKDSVEPHFPAFDPADVTLLGEGFASYSGYYQFKIQKGEALTTANAKFTYIFRKTPAGVKIVTHNSGITPQGIVTA